MPYVVEQRPFGKDVTSSVYDKARQGSMALRSHTGWEAVYSFRTGKRSKSDWKDPADVYKPPRGNIFEILDYRRKFIERQITQIERRAGSLTHLVTSDIGNEFMTSRTSVTVGSNSCSFNAGGVWPSTGTNLIPRFTYSHTADGVMVMKHPIPDIVGFGASKGIKSVSDDGSSSFPSASQFNDISSKQVQSMNPFQKQSLFAASLIELSRGDLPGLGKRLREWATTISSLKRVEFRSLEEAWQVVLQPMLKHYGSEYLNVQFGWKPLLMDIAAAIKTLIALDSALFPQQSTRRRRNWLVSNMTSSLSANTNLDIAFPLAPNATLQSCWAGTVTKSGSFGSPYFNVKATMTSAQETSIRTVAKFHTGMTPNSSNNSYLDRLTDLLGMELTPEVLWEVTPWSWLVDYFTNIGTVISNLTNVGLTNTLMNYAYTTVQRKTTVGCLADRPAGMAGVPVVFYTTEQRVRRVASPFGFGFSTSGLSTSQWNILVALGLARSR